MGYNPDCIVGVHLDTAWDHPLGWSELIDQYLATADAPFISLYHPHKQQDRYKDKAVESERSRGGELSDKTIQSILSSSTSITVIGGYWRGCHRHTTTQIASGICSRRSDSDYTLHIPTQYVSASLWTVSETQYSTIERGAEAYRKEIEAKIEKDPSYTLEYDIDLEEPPEIWFNILCNNNNQIKPHKDKGMIHRKPQHRLRYKNRIYHVEGQ